jgi:hypothetical protein
MAYYYEDQTRHTDVSTDGRMRLDEVISLLQHLNHQTQEPWIDSFNYRYDETGNKTYLSLVTCIDRPHKPNV